MAEFPALPLFTDAYIADTAHLTNEEHGVYLRLLMFAWRTEACALPDNDARLALMVGVTKGKWNKMKPTIMSFWRLSDEGWTQKKLTSQRAFVSKQREQKRIAGEASAKARALKSLDTSSTAVDPPLPTAPQQPKPIPITTVKRVTKVTPVAFEDFWNQYPHRGGAKKGKKEALRVYTRQMNAGISEQTMVNGAIRYSGDAQVLDGRGKGPEPWLNQQCWEDEIEQPKGGQYNGNGNSRSEQATLKLVHELDDASRIAIARLQGGSST